MSKLKQFAMYVSMQDQCKIKKMFDVYCFCLTVTLSRSPLVSYDDTVILDKDCSKRPPRMPVIIHGLFSILMVRMQSTIVYDLRSVTEYINIEHEMPQILSPPTSSNYDLFKCLEF